MEPDFEALRAERNAAMEKVEKEFRDKGWEVSFCSSRDKNACYCACATGGPCEHDWTGKLYKSEGLISATCSKCGMTAYSHTLHACN